MKNLYIQFSKNDEVTMGRAFRNNPTYKTDFGMIDPDLLQDIITRIGNAEVIQTFDENIGKTDWISDLFNYRNARSERDYRKFIRKCIAKEIEGEPTDNVTLMD